MLSQLDLNYLDIFKKKYVYGCKICGGKDSFCSCWKSYNEEIRKVSAGIPVKYRRYTIDDFTHPQLVEQKKFIQNVLSNFDDIRLNGDTLYFHGTSGTAKTMSAVLIGVEAIKRGYEVHYYDSLQSIASKLKQAWAEEDTATIIHNVSASDLVIVDNIGSENILNENIRYELCNFFKQRSYNGLPTIFISPVSIDEIPLKLDKDIIELFLKNSFKSVLFKGFDYSKKVLGA